MKKVISLFALLVLCIPLVFSAGTPVFDWSAFIQFAEEAYKEYERWETTYNKIKADYELAEKRFADADWSSFLDVTRYTTNGLDSISDLYQDFSGKTSATLEEAKQVGFMIDSGLNNPVTKNDPGYWIDVIRQTTTTDDPYAETSAEIEKTSDSFSSVEDRKIASETGATQASSQSEIDRDLAIYTAIDTLTTSVDALKASQETKRIEDEVTAIKARERNDAIALASESVLRNGDSLIAEKYEDSFSYSQYEYFAEDPSTMNLKFNF